jgi:uncharacterized membrane protein YfcA
MIEAIGFWWFLGLIPIVSFLYSSVGHGGASGYLALMALFSFPMVFMKPTALLLNLFVAGIAFIQFYRGGHFKKSLFTSFALGSIPFAYFGGTISVDPILYKRILGVLLIFAVLRMLIRLRNYSEPPRSIPFFAGVGIGAIIGFFSGLIGIGGGIILTPRSSAISLGSSKRSCSGIGPFYLGKFGFRPRWPVTVGCHAVSIYDSAGGLSAYRWIFR